MGGGWYTVATSRLNMQNHRVLIKLRNSDFSVHLISVNNLIPIQTLANLFKFFDLNSNAHYFYRSPGDCEKLTLS